MDENKEKWKMFKNYIHNELGVSDETIREWIKDAVSEQVNKLLKQEFEKFSISDYLVKTLKSFLTKDQDMDHTIYRENAFDALVRQVSDKVAKLIYKSIKFNEINIGN